MVTTAEVVGWRQTNQRGSEQSSQHEPCRTEKKSGSSGRNHCGFISSFHCCNCLNVQDVTVSMTSHQYECPQMWGGKASLSGCLTLPVIPTLFPQKWLTAGQTTVPFLQKLLLGGLWAYECAALITLQQTTETCSSAGEFLKSWYVNLQHETQNVNLSKDLIYLQMLTFAGYLVNKVLFPHMFNTSALYCPHNRKWIINHSVSCINKT